MSDSQKDRIARMRAWQTFETEDFRASDLEAVLSAAETLADQGKPQITDAMVERGAVVMAEITGEPRVGRFERTMTRAVLEAALGEKSE